MAEEIVAPRWWINVPAQVASIPSKKLNSTAKLVFGEVYSMLNAVSSFYMNNKALGEKVGVSERQVSRSISKLNELELIKVNIVYVKKVPKRLVTINQGSPYMSTPPRHMCLPPHDICGDIENRREDTKRESTSKEDDQQLIEKAKSVIDMLNNKADRKFRYGKNSIGMIKARIKAGYQSKDFAYVIMNKVAEWQGTDMEEYLRPKTLFTEQHMDDYINQRPRFKSSTNQGRNSDDKYRTTDDVDNKRQAEEDKVEQEIEMKMKGQL